MTGNYNEEWNIWKLFSLEGKTAIVTGGARNLGYDMTLALAEAGSDVVITSRTLENAEESAGEIMHGNYKEKGISNGIGYSS